MRPRLVKPPARPAKRQPPDPQDPERRFAVRLGKRIRKARQNRELTQAELGRLLGVSQVQVSNYERGVDAVSAWMLSRLAEALRVRPRALLGDHDS